MAGQFLSGLTKRTEWEARTISAIMKLYKLPRNEYELITSICITWVWHFHYGDVIMGAIASQITSLTIVYLTVYSDADRRKHQSSASLVFVRGIHRGPMNFPHKWPVTRKMFPFDDFNMCSRCCYLSWNLRMVPTRNYNIYYKHKTYRYRIYGEMPNARHISV